MPALVGADGSVKLDPYILFSVEVLLEFAGSYVTTYEAALHFAYKVMSEVVVNPVAFSALSSPEPFAAVFHPAKVKPALARVPELLAIM